MALFNRRRPTTGTNSNHNRTSLNPDVQSNATVLNTSAASGATVLNNESVSDAFITPGTIVCEKYEIKRELNVQTGEADLFICTYNGKEYIAKIYRRQMAIKPEVAQELSYIRSPYVARIFDMGEYEGYPVEILPYYKNGSLQGHKFTIEQLKKDIIPSLNAGLKVLHDHGIIHKDLKPSNIMLNDDNRTVSIIDFGISTVVRNGSTVVVTHTGLTPEYSAPETFRGLFLAESDYYSFGITLFELYAGHSPYDGLSQEQIAQFAVIQKVPLPDDMDQSLKNLITGLTYNDITNRNDLDNPNRRWTYTEVDNWSKGMNQPIPGSSAGSTTSGEFRAYNFQGDRYDTMDGLVTALGTNWENGKKQLFRGTLGGHFNSINAEIATICGDAQDEMDEGKKDPDLIFFETLYKMDPDMSKIFWKGNVYRDLDDIGNRILTSMRKKDHTMDKLLSEMLTSGIFSSYIKCVKPSAKEQIKTMEAFESAHRTFGGNGAEKAGYQLGYMLSDQKTLVLEVKDSKAAASKEFRNVDAIADYMLQLLDQSQETFDRFCRMLLDENDELNPQFECWLIATGKQKAIDDWRNELFV